MTLLKKGHFWVYEEGLFIGLNTFTFKQVGRELPIPSCFSAAHLLFTTFVSPYSFLYFF